jgi:8-oxo-dGTP diphosphatase
MSLEVKIHAAQTSILRELLFHPSAGFAELQKPTNLTSDHFTFHIKRLLELDLVQKTGGGRYTLTPRGKEYANKLDTDQNTIERQPKVAVLLAISRTRNGRKEFIFQERTKHPYYGYWGFPTGKIRWGESILETAARELAEETGLTADFTLQGVYHERTFQKESGDLLEDKIFFVIACSRPRGRLVEKFEGGLNRWATPEETLSHKVYSSFHTELAVALGEESFYEEIHEYSKEEF